eukprot:1606732-Prymnesium_polylepis.1
MKYATECAQGVVTACVGTLGSWIHMGSGLGTRSRGRFLALRSPGEIATAGARRCCVAALQWPPG